MANGLIDELCPYNGCSLRKFFHLEFRLCKRIPTTRKEFCKLHENFFTQQAPISRTSCPDSPDSTLQNLQGAIIPQTSVLRLPIREEEGEATCGMFQKAKTQAKTRMMMLMWRTDCIMDKKPFTTHLYLATTQHYKCSGKVLHERITQLNTSTAVHQFRNYVIATFKSTPDLYAMHSNSVRILFS